MTVTGLVTMLVVGGIIGSLGRLVIPARQPVPMWLTLLIGVLAAFVGTIVARAVGIPSATSGIDWLELLVQVVVAAIGVASAANLYARRGVRSGARRSVREPTEPSGLPPRSEPRQPWEPRGRRADPPPTSDPWPAREARPGPPPRQQQAAGTPPPPRAQPPAPSRIFVSYRRSDSRHAARGVADRLRAHFGRQEVFMDVDSLDAGVDFVDGVLEAIRASAVVIVLIGERWLTAEDDRGLRRLDDPRDNVRIEIEQALGQRKPVVPVLLDRADMPRPDALPPPLAALTRLNGIRLDHVSWDADVDVLVGAIARLRTRPS